MFEDRSSVPHGRLRLFAASIMVAGLVAITAPSPASAQEVVSSWAELNAALANPAVDEVQLGVAINESSQQLNIPAGRHITVDLQGHSLTVRNVVLAEGADLTIADAASTGTLSVE